VTLIKGQNTPVGSDQLRVALVWSTRAGLEVDLTALLCTPTGKADDDADFVFYNAPQHPSGAVIHRGYSTDSGARTTSDVVMVTLSAVPNRIETIRFVASASTRFADVGPCRTELHDSVNGELLRFEVTGVNETAMVLGELYRRGDGWKYRAVGQGYSDGLAGLARDYGITVDDPGPMAPNASAASTASTTPASSRPAAPTPPTPIPQTTGRPPIDWLNPPVPAGYEV